MKTFIFTTLSLLFITSISNAHHHNSSKHSKRSKRMFSKMVKNLELTEAQQKTFMEIRESNMAATKPIREELKNLRVNQKNMLKVDGQEAQLKVNFEKMKAAKSKLMNLRFESKLKKYSLLTTEQKIKWAEHKEKKRKRRKH